eukprot:3189883-Rhodomonas_salina.4
MPRTDLAYGAVCPRLCYAMPGTYLVYDTRRMALCDAGINTADGAISRHACNAMRGTDVAYAATSEWHQRQTKTQSEYYHARSGSRYLAAYLPSYARATRCLALSARRAPERVLFARDGGLRGSALPGSEAVDRALKVPIVLRASYGMSGTDARY